MNKNIFSRLLLILIFNFITVIPISHGDDKASPGQNGHGNLQFEDVPLMQAIEKGDLDLVKKLVHEGTSINVKLFNGMQPIHEATADGQVDIAKYLLESGADVNSKMANDITPMFIAIETQNVDIAKLLISKGAQYSGRDISTAIFKDDLDIIKLLVTTPELANLNGRNNMTLLHVAAMTGRPAIVQYLIDQGAKVDVKNSKGDTPLDLATRNKDRLSGLVAHGVNKKEILDQGFNYDGYDNVISILKKSGSKK